MKPLIRLKLYRNVQEYLFPRQIELTSVQITYQTSTADHDIWTRVALEAYGPELAAFLHDPDDRTPKLCAELTVDKRVEYYGNIVIAHCECTMPLRALCVSTAELVMRLELQEHPAFKFNTKYIDQAQRR